MKQEQQQLEGIVKKEQKGFRESTLGKTLIAGTVGLVLGLGLGYVVRCSINPNEVTSYTQLESLEESMPSTVQYLNDGIRGVFGKEKRFDKYNSNTPVQE